MSGNFSKGIKFLMKKRDLWPLMGVLGTALSCGVAFGIYSLTHKSDVLYDRRKPPPWERLDPNKKQKLLKYSNEEIIKNEELEQLKREIGSQWNSKPD